MQSPFEKGERGNEALQEAHREAVETIKGQQDASIMGYLGGFGTALVEAVSAGKEDAGKFMDGMEESA